MRHLAFLRPLVNLLLPCPCCINHLTEDAQSFIMTSNDNYAFGGPRTGDFLSVDQPRRAILGAVGDMSKHALTGDDDAGNYGSAPDNKMVNPFALYTATNHPLASFILAKSTTRSFTNK